MALTAPAFKRGNSSTELPSSGGMKSCKEEGLPLVRDAECPFLYEMRWDGVWLLWPCCSQSEYSYQKHSFCCYLNAKKVFMWKQMNKLRHISMLKQPALPWSFFLLQSEMNGYVGAVYVCVCMCVCVCTLPPTHMNAYTQSEAHPWICFTVFLSVPVAVHSGKANQSL